MGVVNLSKENFEKVKVMGNTYYENTKGKMIFVSPKGKDGKDVFLVVGNDLTIEIARKLVQSNKGAAVYAKGQKPQEK